MNPYSLHIYIYIYIYICVNVCVMGVRLFICVCVCVCVLSIYIYIYIYTCVSMYLYNKQTPSLFITQTVERNWVIMKMKTFMFRAILGVFRLFLWFSALTSPLPMGKEYVGGEMLKRCPNRWVSMLCPYFMFVKSRFFKNRTTCEPDAAHTIATLCACF